MSLHRSPNNQIEEVEDQPQQHNDSTDNIPLQKLSQEAKGLPAANDPFLVQFDDNESANPRNFSPPRKWFLTILLGSLAAVGSFGSSVTAPAEDALSRYLGISYEATILTVSLYVLGFAFGPCIWAPLGEVYGRRASILPPVVAHALFSIGTATSKNAGSVFVTRFFGGVFASAPISNVAAAMGDLFEPKDRGVAVSFYTVCVSGGPTVAPLVGAAVTVSKNLGWRCKSMSPGHRDLNAFRHYLNLTLHLRDGVHRSHLCGSDGTSDLDFSAGTLRSSDSATESPTLAERDR